MAACDAVPSPRPTLNTFAQGAPALAVAGVFFCRQHSTHAQARPRYHRSNMHKAPPPPPPAAGTHCRRAPPPLPCATARAPPAPRTRTRSSHAGSTCRRRATAGTRSTGPPGGVVCRGGGGGDVVRGTCVRGGGTFRSSAQWGTARERVAHVHLTTKCTPNTSSCWSRKRRDAHNMV